MSCEGWLLVSVPSYSAPHAAPLRPPLALYRPDRVARRFAIGAACTVTVALLAGAIAAVPAADDSALATGEGTLTPAGITWVVSFLIFLLAQLAAYFATCAWLHLVRRNAEVLNPTYIHRYSVGWVWTSWLVPIVSLWFPYQVVADVRGATSPSGRSGVWLLRQWWAAWLFVWILTGASNEARASWDAPLQALAALLSVAALVAWIRINREISRSQARSAVAQGWSPALTFGGPIPAGAVVATGSPGTGDAWPETVTSLPADTPPTDTPGWAPAVAGVPPPSRPVPYPQPAAYAEPPSPYAAVPYPGGPGPGAAGNPGVWWGRPASVAMGVWAFVLAVLPLFVTWVVAIGLAVAVLLRPDDGWRRGRGLAIAALVISSGWILLGFGLVIAGVTLPDPEVDSVASSNNDGDREPDPDQTPSIDVRASALEVGDCLLKPPGDVAVIAKLALCSDPHKAEVYAVWEMGGGPRASIGKQVDLADDGCFKRSSPSSDAATTRRPWTTPGWRRATGPGLTTSARRFAWSTTKPRSPGPCGVPAAEARREPCRPVLPRPLIDASTRPGPGGSRVELARSRRGRAATRSTPDAPSVRQLATRRALVSPTSMPCSRNRFSPRIFFLACSVSCG